MKVFSHLLVIAFLAVAFVSKAQMLDRFELEKANKAMLNSVKKKSRAAKAWIEVAPDGYWYYRVSANKNEGPYGAYDQNGEEIVPLNAYNSFLEYLPAMEAGRTKLRRDPNAKLPGDFVLSHPKVDGAFIGRAPGKTSFISKDGSVFIVPDDGMNFVIYPGWVVINALTAAPDRHGESVAPNMLLGISTEPGNAMSVYTSDGRLYLPNVSGFIVDENQNMTYTRYMDGVPKQGLKNLEDTDIDIPCEYAGIIVSDGKYMVNETKSSPSHEYVKGTSGKVDFRDEGERLFEIEDWPGVIRYYAGTGADTSWGKYYTGMAMMNLAHSDLIAKKMYIEEVNQGRWDSLNSMFANRSFMDVDVTTDIELLLAAKEVLGSNLMESDKFGQKSAYGIESCDECLAETVPFVMDNYDNALRAHKSHNVAEAKKVEEEQQRSQQRAMMFVGMLNSIVSSIGSQQAEGQKVSNGGTGTIAAPVGSTGSVDTQPVDNTSRKGFLKGQIIEWKNKLKKAEASRQQVFDDYEKNPSRAAKRALESKEKTVNECLDMIRQYESELNRL